MALSSSLWMGDLDTYMDEIFISSAFQQLGENVLHVKLIKNKNVSTASYCFVDFGDVEVANRAILRINGKIIPGSNPPRRFKLNPASYGKEHVLLPEFSLYIGDLSSDVDDYQLYSAFAKRYRSVRAAKVVLGSSGKNKGFGFVRFSEETDQQRALIEMQHMTGIGRNPIRVSLAQPKGSEYSSSSSKYRRDHDSGSGYNSYSSHYPGSYYAGSYSWGGYTYNYNQYCPPPPTHQLKHLHKLNWFNYNTPDPGVEVNINRENREFMESSESFLEAIEKSRWFPLDNVMSQIPAAGS
ncbi:tRNA selenocysteine 1-associated protein 1-like [Gigantopelta aegis]|uniref:tRNA selenocysteine 1-associated protein 1-like n=1 Tax=Gigantopelta aegis TaxID=1735272 RepID=UPI001B889690|nr:tRNA selenocysteine 1-associated protein 1-like [Gigantopelta aegis]